MTRRLRAAWQAFRLWSVSRDSLELPLQRRATAGGLRWAVLPLGVALIVLWQSVFFRTASSEPLTLKSRSYVLKASGGVLMWQHEFAYFLYYLGLFPVATTAQDLDFSEAGARQLLQTRGDTLVMDRFWTVRYGEPLKTYLYLPHALWEGSPTRWPNMLHANAAAWTLALVVLFAGFWKVGHAPLGAILVLVLGSNPFQVSEVYARNNVFGWVITTALLVLGLHLPLLGERRPSRAYLWSLPLLAGLLLATVRQIRTEPALIGVSGAAAYLTAAFLSRRERLAMVALLAVAYGGGTQAWQGYFDAKFREAYRVVKAAGGHPYDGPRQSSHFVWHALWCGLGDFDTRHGHVWDDLAAKDWALPIMQQRGFKAEGYPALEAQNFDSLTLGVYWDRDRRYARTPFETPEYTAVVRESVLHDVSGDPSWYFAILAKRLLRILTEVTSPSLAVGSRPGFSLPAGPLWGLLTLPVGALLVRSRSTFLLKALLFTLPLGLTALLVYSGGGTVYYGIVHLVALAYCVAWVLEGALAWLATRVVVGFVWRGKLHLVPHDPVALTRRRAG